MHCGSGMTTALVDGYNMVFRAFYGMPELTRSDGLPNGAVHGWVRILWYLEDNMRPDRLVAFFDLDGAARQTALRDDYKANRGETPPALVQQLPYIRRLTAAFGYGPVERSGTEADDLIASAACALRAAGGQAAIVSADKDFAQLIGPGISQWLPPPTANPKAGWQQLSVDGVVAKFGVPPDKIAAYLALVGDTADNIPGLRGCGPKTAGEWLRRYGSLEAIIAHCGELAPKRFQAMVHAQQDELRRNLQMTTVDATLSVDLAAVPPANPAAALELLAELEMAGTAARYRQRLEKRGLAG
jgi:DNA polymerase I